MPRWNWRPRYSLKTFLLGCVFMGCGAVWISHHLHDYRTEQHIVRAINRASAAALLPL